MVQHPSTSPKYVWRWLSLVTSDNSPSGSAAKDVTATGSVNERTGTIHDVLALAQIVSMSIARPGSSGLLRN
jgi:hypothetical protein